MSKNKLENLKNNCTTIISKNGFPCVCVDRYTGPYCQYAPSF